MPAKNGYASSIIPPVPVSKPRMQRIIALLILGTVLLISGDGCRNKEEPSMVDLDQIESDGSTNDRLLFKNEIEREKWREGRYKKKQF